MTAGVVIHTPKRQKVSKVPGTNCQKPRGVRKSLKDSRSRLYGGEVTQRIANPLPGVEIICLFLSKTALKGRNRGRICQNISTGRGSPMRYQLGALGALSLALAGCGVRVDQANASTVDGRRFSIDCEVMACVVKDWQTGREFLAWRDGGIVEIGPTPNEVAARELAGGPEVEP